MQVISARCLCGKTFDTLQEMSDHQKEDHTQEEMLELMYADKPKTNRYDPIEVHIEVKMKDGGNRWVDSSTFIHHEEYLARILDLTEEFREQMKLLAIDAMDRKSREENPDENS